MPISNGMPLQQWHTLPGHVVRALNEVRDLREFLDGSCEWTPIFDDGVIVYDYKRDGAQKELWDFVMAIPMVKERHGAKSAFGRRKIYFPGCVYVDWLPIYADGLKAGRRYWSGFNWQRDAVRLLMDNEDAGAFDIWVAQRMDQKTRSWKEDSSGLDLSTQMNSERVRMWIVPVARSKEDDGRMLGETIRNWLHYSQESGPPVGGAKSILELKEVPLGRKKAKPAYYCEVNLAGTKPESFEALIGMLATYTELVAPLEEIIVA